MKLCAFIYAFDHNKSQMGLMRLVTSGYKPDLVIAQGKKVLPPNKDTLDIVPKNVHTLCEWKHLLWSLGIHFIEADHDSDEAHREIVRLGCDVGVILGARILKKPTIGLFQHGVLNMHPGILPGNRGLDNLKRAILLDLEPAVTFHLIDERIDAGLLLRVTRVPIYAQDTLHSIFLRHQKIEIDGMIQIFDQYGQLLPLNFDPGNYHQALGDSADEQILLKFHDWKMKWRTDATR